MEKTLILVSLLLAFLAFEFVTCKCGTSALKRKGRSIPNGNLTSALGNQTADLPVTYIIGGRYAKPGEFPWQVFLKIYYAKNSKSYTACGGVIWDSKNILTAAHCFLQCKRGKTQAAKKVTYCVGEHNTKKKDGEKCFDATKWINHHGYKACSKHFKNDITVVKMRKPLKLPGLKKGAGSINSACHPSNSLKPKTVILSGWGRTSRSSTAGSDVLKTINLPVWTTKKCRKKWPKVDNSQICVGGVANQNSCQGDSGGPIVTMKGGKAYVVGLSSFGPTPCAKKGWPNVFTRVAHFNSWIKQKTR